jgi:hypothetical protein
LRGGLEWLYEQINQRDASTQNEFIENIYDLIKLYSDDFELNQHNKINPDYS